MTQSLAEQARLNPDTTRAWLESLDPATAVEALYDWSLWARPEQLPPPGDWVHWLIQAGRGWGKTRVGAEWVRDQVAAGRRRLALVARTAADTRDVMVEGESGILAVCHPDDRPKYEPSKRRLTWANGAQATLYSADEPDLLRGPQHDGAWADELASWRFPDAWDQIKFGLRMGAHPQVVVTTTPRPTKLIRDLAADPTTVVTRGRSLDNKANLAAAFFTHIVNKYQGSRLGRQELEGELLDDNPNALWTRADIEKGRLRKLEVDLRRIVIPIDPAATSGEDSDLTGIVPVGVDDQDPEHYYVLDDLSLQASPGEWAAAAVRAYLYWGADRIIGEANNGGDMIEAVIRSVVIDGQPAGKNISYEKVTATRGKALRAEPVAALYEQGRVHHIGTLAALEDQLCEFDPLDASQKSPDRMDALVWGITALMGGVDGYGFIPFYQKEKERRGGKPWDESSPKKPVSLIQF